MIDNVRLAKELISRFGVDMDFWWRNADRDLVLEFPFAGSLGMATRFVGIDACRALLESVLKRAAGLTFRDTSAMAMADPAFVLLEYRGSCPAKNGTYEQTYASVMRFQDGKLILYREYLDTAEVTRAFG
jgi:ketosteroid isomerase-like protein